MSPFSIHVLFITRKATQGFSQEAPEVLVAWDDHTVAENFEGFQAECDAALKSLGADLDQYRLVEIKIDGAKLAQLFNKPVLSGILA